LKYAKTIQTEREWLLGMRAHDLEVLSRARLPLQWRWRSNWPRRRKNPSSTSQTRYPNLLGNLIILF
jgi:hypothetical protein